MQQANFQINPEASLDVRFIGHEKTPLIVIDDFLLDTRELIEFACESVSYGPDATSAYPGVRGGLPRPYLQSVLNGIFQLLFKAYSVPETFSMRPVNSVFSLLATSETDLIPAQCVPHFDNVEPYYLAILHYLNPGDFCPTGFFRHKPTGIERISKSRLDEFMQSSGRFIQANGDPAQAYIKASNEHFELYDQVAYKPNRLAVYPGNLLHSGLVNPGQDINPDPASGRLTANIFVNFSESPAA